MTRILFTLLEFIFFFSVSTFLIQIVGICNFSTNRSYGVFVVDYEQLFTEAYSEPSHISKMEYLAKIVNG